MAALGWVLATLLIHSTLPRQHNRGLRPQDVRTRKRRRSRRIPAQQSPNVMSSCQHRFEFLHKDVYAAPTIYMTFVFEMTEPGL